VEEDLNEIKINEGCYQLDGFLGDWFIRKAMWSTPATIKQNITSFKKFYRCMLEKEFIKKEDYEQLIDDIKNEGEEWLEKCAYYNDPDGDYDPEVFHGFKF
jgi:hypothetical protein